MTDPQIKVISVNISEKKGTIKIQKSGDVRIKFTQDLLEIIESELKKTQSIEFNNFR